MTNSASPRAKDACTGISKATPPTDADALIGIGASSIGRLPQGYVQNAPDMGHYARSISAGTFATVKGLALTDDDRLRAAIIERLMCDLALDLDMTSAARRALRR